MKINTKIFIASILAVFSLVMAVITVVSPEVVLAAFRTNGVSEPAGTYRLYSAITATSSSATSSEIFIAGAKKVTVYVSTPVSTTTATSTFSVQTSVDGVNYLTFNKLIENTANTNAQNITRVASKVLVATSSAVLSLDLTSDTFIGMKCIGDATTTAALTSTSTQRQACSVLVQY